jgi:hypothetical protein
MSLVFSATRELGDARITQPFQMKQRKKNNAPEFNLRPANKTLRGGRDCLFFPKNSCTERIIAKLLCFGSNRNQKPPYYKHYASYYAAFLNTNTDRSL